jgi:hypothetical protein
MDEALAWVGLIPADRYVLRRIVNARALVSPTTQRHLYGWSAIARLIGCDRKAVARWHAQGIAQRHAASSTKANVPGVVSASLRIASMPLSHRPASC